MNTVMYYEEGYKYQLAQDCLLMTPICGYHCTIPFAELQTDGSLLLLKGFAWDGASGLTIDTKSSQRGSAGHDALYRMLRANLIPHNPCFHLANKFLCEQCKIDGMWHWRANAWFRAVEKFGDAYAAVQPDKILIAP
jgi:hypothetical protein